ncbi:MAG TPA: hypothetical protein DEP84_24915, partial [Chloroflexi bacterium]|nr:hypothetical protein [Chloroflexota bacterium]
QAFPALIERSIFAAGVRALMALVAGAFYLALGGRLAPTTSAATQLPPLLALFLTWFGLDHLLWIGNALARGGRAHARAFLRAITGASLLVELIPLPFALLFAAAWLTFDPALQFLFSIAVVGVAVIVRVLAGSLRHSRERLRTVSLLSEFSEAVVHAQLDESRLSMLLLEFINRLTIQPVHFTLALHEDGTWRTVCVAGEAAPDREESLALVSEHIRMAPETRLLPDLSPRSVHAALTEHVLLQEGRALVAPLIVGDRLLGLFTVESTGLMSSETAQTLALLGAQTAVAIETARHYRQEQWRALQLQTIAEVSRQVVAILDLDELFDHVVDLIKETFKYYHVQIYLVDAEREEVVFRAGSGPVGEALARRPPRCPLNDPEHSIIGWVATHAEPLMVNDIAVEPRYVRDDARLLPDTRAELAVPLMVENRVLGVLDVQSDTPGAFDQDDHFTLATLADQVAIAIEDARLYAAQREETWVNTALLQVAEAVSTLTRLGEVLETVVRITPILTGASATAIYLWRDVEGRSGFPQRRRDGQTGSSFELADAYGLDRADLARLTALRPALAEFPLLDEVSREQHLVTVPNASASPLIPPPYDRFLVPADVEGRAVPAEGGELPAHRYSLVAAPLLAQGEAVGVLLLGFLPDAAALSDRRRALIAGIGQQAAVAIQAARLYAAQRDEAWITTALLQVAEAVASRNELPDVLQLITRLTIMLAEVERCGIYLWDAEARQLVPAQVCGLPSELEEQWGQTMLTEATFPALPKVVEASAPLLLDDSPERNRGGLSVFFNPLVVACPLQAHDQFLGLMVVDLPRDVVALTDRNRAILAGIARQISIGVENARLNREALENERRTQELTLARQLQTALLPERPPEVPGYELAGYWRPAREVAGDFYDFFPLSHDRQAVTIADVADKGMAAALFMVLTRSALRESVWNEEQAGAALARTNTLLARDARRGMFVTCFLALLSPREGQLVASNAGHLPPLIYDSVADSFASFALRNLPLGILDEVRYPEATIELSPGSFIVLYTDGITDASDDQMRLFGTRRLADVVWAHRTDSAGEIVKAIVAAVTAFNADEHAFDDLTVVVLKRRPE